MFGQSCSGKQNGFSGFMDFMIFNEIMNGGQKKQKSKAPEPKCDWIDELEVLDVLEDEGE